MIFIHRLLVRFLIISYRLSALYMTGNETVIIANIINYVTMQFSLPLEV